MDTEITMHRCAGIGITDTITPGTIAITAMQLCPGGGGISGRRFEKVTMSIRSDTAINKVKCMQNRNNSDLLKDFYQHMKDNSTSESYQKGNLKAMVHFAEHLGPATSFYHVNLKEQIVMFLNTKIKPEQIDPDKKSITTWNDYLWRLKLFFRWLHNKKIREINGEEVKPDDEWRTTSFLQQIKKKKTKRLSPYLETEIWGIEMSCLQ